MCGFVPEEVSGPLPSWWAFLRQDREAFRRAHSSSLAPNFCSSSHTCSSLMSSSPSRVTSPGLISCKNQFTTDWWLALKRMEGERKTKLCENNTGVSIWNNENVTCVTSFLRLTMRNQWPRRGKSSSSALRSSKATLHLQDSWRLKYFTSFPWGQTETEELRQISAKRAGTKVPQNVWHEVTRQTARPEPCEPPAGPRWPLTSQHSIATALLRKGSTANLQDFQPLSDFWVFASSPHVCLEPRSTQKPEEAAHGR